MLEVRDSVRTNRITAQNIHDWPSVNGYRERVAVAGSRCKQLISKLNFLSFVPNLCDLQ